MDTISIGVALTENGSCRSKFAKFGDYQSSKFVSDSVLLKLNFFILATMFHLWLRLCTTFFFL
jgi:hypothetical protein